MSTETSRWAREPYPDYVREVNQSIEFSGLDVDYFTRGKATHLIRIARDAFGAERRIKALDIGCGPAALHPMLGPEFSDIVGIDVSEPALEIAAQASPGGRYLSYDGCTLPVDDESFDFSFTICVMHHVPPKDWPAFVAEAYRATRAGGLFAVIEHNPFNPLTRLAVSRCPFDHDAVLLRPKQTTALLRQAGFSVVGIDYIFFLPLDAGWVGPLERRLKWLPLGAQYIALGRKEPL